MSVKKVLYIGRFELPDKNASANRVIGTSLLLKSMGYEVTLIGISDNPDSLLNPKYYKDLCYHSILKPHNLIQWVGYSFKIEYVKKYINLYGKPEIIIAYNYPYFALKKLSKYCKKNDIILISDVADWHYNFKSKNVLLLPKKIESKLRMKNLPKLSDGIIAISSYLYSHYKDDAKEILYLPPLIDVTDTKWLPNLSNKQVVEITYFGNPGTSTHKIHEMLSFFRSNGDYHFNLVGMNFNGETSENVDVYGKLNHEVALKIVSQSDYTIFIRDDNITNKSGFPTKFVESHTLGVPVITNYPNNLENYLTENKTIVINELKDIEKIKLVKRVNKEKFDTFDYNQHKNDAFTFIEKLKVKRNV